LLQAATLGVSLGIQPIIVVCTDPSLIPQIIAAFDSDFALVENDSPESGEKLDPRALEWKEKLAEAEKELDFRRTSYERSLNDASEKRYQMGAQIDQQNGEILNLTRKLLTREASLISITALTSDPIIKAVVERTLQQQL
jgi:hypothetical protein